MQMLGLEVAQRHPGAVPIVVATTGPLPHQVPGVAPPVGDALHPARRDPGPVGDVVILFS